MLGHGPVGSAPIGALEEVELRDPPLNGDSAKQFIEEDEFGLSEIVQSVKRVLRTRIVSDGYAIGIEGAWGSGKSSFLNFIEQSLKQDADAYQKIIRFDPWLIGDKRTLLRVFFFELSQAIGEFRNDARVKEKLGYKENIAPVLNRLVKSIDEYARYIEVAAKVSNTAAALDPSLYMKAAALLFSAVLWIGERFRKSPPSLEDLKVKIVGDLQTLKNLLPGVSIAILIDDTDRLDPAESVEILRLIKAVANFPVVTYLVCFDLTILSAQVNRIIQVGSGADYIEKIFQQILPLPPQEPFALRRFVRKKLRDAFPEEDNYDPADLEFQGRRDLIYDQWLGKLISTPRDAIRLCENIKFGWPYLRGRGDFLDYVWLQLIKLKRRDLYDWTQRYVTGLGSYRDGGRPWDVARHVEAEKLSSILRDIGWAESDYRWQMSQILPGVKFIHLEGDSREVFKFDPDSELSDFEARRRLGSPSHWRFYFAFGKPSYALDDAEVTGFKVLAASDGAGAAKLLIDLARKPHRVACYYLTVLLDRLKDGSGSTSVEEQIGMAWAFSSMMDQLPRTGEVQFSANDPWRQAIRLMTSAVGAEFAGICARGTSVCWLALALRDQGFALGIAGKDTKSSADDRAWLTRPQYENSIEALVSRFRTMSLPEILDRPEPLQILFCWHDHNANDVRNFIGSATKVDDDLFMKFLSGIMGWVSSSAHGLFQTLHPATVELFLDLADTKGRLLWIKSASETPDQRRNLADELLLALENRNRPNRPLKALSGEAFQSPFSLDGH